MLRKAKGITARTIILRTGLVLAVWLLPLGHRCVAEDNGAISRSIEAVKTDFGNFYLNRANLTKLGIGVAGAAVWLHNSTMEEWAQKSFRATVVGGPALLFLATAIGADRPTEGDSHWKPFQNIHGVSGHAFIGGIPFITAAKMSENPYQKAIFYGLSTVTGLSRINDDRHYFSQVALGWYLAYWSCAAVEKGNDRQEGRVHVQFAAVPKGIGITVQKRY